MLRAPSPALSKAPWSWCSAKAGVGWLGTAEGLSCKYLALGLTPLAAFFPNGVSTSEGRWPQPSPITELFAFGLGLRDPCLHAKFTEEPRKLSHAEEKAATYEIKASRRLGMVIIHKHSDTPLARAKGVRTESFGKMNQGEIYLSAWRFPVSSRSHSWKTRKP